MNDKDTCPNLLPWPVNERHTEEDVWNKVSVHLFPHPYLDAYRIAAVLDIDAFSLKTGMGEEFVAEIGRVLFQKIIAQFVALRMTK